jgi:hypothetical protein
LYGSFLFLTAAGPQAAHKIRNFTILLTQNWLTMSEVTLTAYNVKTKEKGVPIQDAVVTRTAKGGYMAQGHDGKGNKLTTLLGEEKALAAIKAGVAMKGWED